MLARELIDAQILLEEQDHLLRDLPLQYDQISEALPYGIWICGPDGEIRHMSASFLRLLGTSLVECQRFGWWIGQPQEEAASTREDWHSSIMQGAAYDREHHLMGQDGRRHWVLMRGGPVRDEGGKITSWVGISLDIEYRKQAESALVESEDRFRQIADTAPVLIWMTGPEGTVQYANRSYRHFTGRSMPLGDHTSAVHPDDLDRCVRAYNEAFNRRQPFEIDHRLRRSDGEFRFVLTKGIPRLLADGSFLGYIGSITDVTEMKAAMREAQAANDRFRIAAEAMGSYVYDVDLVENRTIRSGGLFNMLGFKPSEVEATPQWWMGRIHPDDEDRARRRIDSAIAPPHSYRAEYRIQNKAGEFVHVLDSGRLILDSAGNPRRMVGTTLNLSPLRRAELDRTICEERFQVLCGLLREPAFATDAKGEVITANKPFQDLLRKGGRARVAPWVDVSTEEDRPALAAAWGKCLISGGALSARFQVPSGVVAQAEVKPVLADGRVSGFVGVIVLDTCAAE